MKQPVRKFMGLMAMCLIALSMLNGARAESPASAQTIWRLLDYIAVDYSAAVENGQVVSDTEYAEMTEFGNSVLMRLSELAPTPEKSELLRQAASLRSAIMEKAVPQDVATIAHGLANQLLAAYPVTLAPSVPPDLAHGKALYIEQCSNCHGVLGKADGPDAKGLEPPPIAFADGERARKRSVFGLYQVIGQGIEETDMASFDWMPPEDRWALAFYVGGLSFDAEDVRRGKDLWASNPALHTDFANLEALTRTTVETLAPRIGEDDAMALVAYLRQNPDVIRSSTDGQLTIARARLDESMQAYRQGDHRKATDLALAAYLDGFEPVEPVLTARDSGLMRDVETAMVDLRTLIGNDAPVEKVEARMATISALFDRAELALGSDQSSSGTSFVGAFTILLREGLEALLIVVAMIAFLRKADRLEVLPYVHAGWTTALVAGALTWVAANSIISIGGASRELTEGLGSLLAAIVLVSVGIWMHGKSQAGAWQTYIKQKMSQALSRKSAWFLFLLAFIVVYREVFETILFFIALWTQGHQLAILGGAGSALAVLAVGAGLLLNYSRRLPIAQFFLFSSILIAVLAVVLTGKGVAALQEAGWIDVTSLTWLPRVEIVGLFPTWQGTLAQLLVFAVLLAAFWMNHRRRPGISV